jgi:hypothetical protein
MAGDPPPGAEGEAVGALRRWQAFGGAWEVVASSSTQVTVALLRCDGGEEVERLTSDDPTLLTFLAGRTRSSDPDAGPAAD